jgi:serine/threonine protein kinase/WD40 repeat protein
MNAPLEELFEAARTLYNPIQRRAFLDAACHDAPDLRRELEELLALEPDARALLDAGVADFHPDASELYQVPPSVIASAAVEEGIGDRVGRYKLREKIGEGGCGVVYVADQEEPVRRRVALKVIKLGMDTKSVIARFEVERQALAMMDHPNIAKVLDAGATETGRPYFVMELVRGAKITEFCNQNRLTTEQRLDLFIQVCQAVQHAHQKGIIHRDLKPSNILVSADNGVAVPKIIDFGIAKATEARLTDLTVYTELNQFIGTPAYMSPEQAEMSGLDIDTRSDIYSLGVLLYELLTGKPPFDARELVTLGVDEMRRTLREKEPLRPSTRLSRLPRLELDSTAKERGLDAPRLCSSVRGDLDWIVMKCLEKDRGRRYATASDLAADIKRHLRDEPVLARAPSQIYVFQKTLRRHKVGFAATTAVIAALALAAILAKRAEREQLRLRRQSEAESYTSDMSAAKQAWDEGDLQRAQGILDSHIPKIGEPDLRGFEWRYLWKLFQVKSLKTISFSKDPVWLLASAPSQRFVVACCEKTIRLLNSQTGSELFRFSHPDPDATDPVYGMSLAARATNLLATHRAGGWVTLWDLSAKKQILSFQAGAMPSDAGGQFLSLSSDGKFLAFAGPGSLSSELVLWDISSVPEVRPRPVWRKEVKNGIVSLAFTPDDSMLFTTDSFRGESIQAWDVGTGATRKPFPKLSTGDDFALAVSPDGSLLAHAGFEPRIYVLDVATRSLRCSFPGHSGTVYSLAFSPDGSRLISGGDDGTVRIWDIRSQKPAGLWRDPHRAGIRSIALGPEGAPIFSAAWDEVRLWSAKPESLAPPIETRQALGDLEISPDGKWVVTSDARFSDGAATNPVVKVWSLSSGTQKCYLAYKNHHGLALAFSPQNNLFALGDGEKEGVVGLWKTADWDRASPATGLQPFGYLTNGFEAGSLRFSPDGKILAVAGLVFVSDHPSDATNRLTFWEVGTWKKLNVLPGPGAAPDLRTAAATVDFSKDRRLLAIGYRDGRVRIWDLEQQRLLREFQEHKDWHFSGVSVRFSGDNRWLVSYVPTEKGLALFDTADPQHARSVGPFLTGPASIRWAGFTPDNKSLVTSDNDGLIKFWSLQTRQPALTLRYTEGTGGRLAVDPAGNLIACRDGRGLVRLLRVPSLEEIDRQAKEP